VDYLAIGIGVDPRIMRAERRRGRIRWKRWERRRVLAGITEYQYRPRRGLRQPRWRRGQWHGHGWRFVVYLLSRGFGRRGWGDWLVCLLQLRRHGWIGALPPVPGWPE